MRKVLACTLFTLLIAALASPVMALVEPLVADGRDLAPTVGTVTVTDDGTNLTITFAITSGNWLISETHVATNYDDNDGDGVVDGIPVNGAGNPKVGKFKYGMEYATPTATPAAITIPIPTGLVAGDLIEIAAHAALVDAGDPEITESAWADGETGTTINPAPKGKNWATKFVYEIGS